MEIAGAATYWLTRFLFQRSLALIYLIAFLVALNQFRPLLGERGLLPVPLFLKRVSFGEAPSLFFLHYSDRFVMLLALGGIALSLFALGGFSERFGTATSATTWGLLWLFYLSFVNVGQTFYSFGWESMLLEAGFLAIFLGGAGTEPSALVIWLYRWMLFRVMFGAGLIKLRADPCWKDLTCLFYHYETQPMPGPLSWYFHYLPHGFHKFSLLVNHFVELAVPWFYFAPQPFAAIAGILTIGFQGTLILSGNLSFLNYLTIVLTIPTFNDQILTKVLPLTIPATIPRALSHDVTLWFLTAGIAALSIFPTLNMLSPRQAMNRTFEPLHLVNTYGAFGAVTKERTEIVFEGTQDSALTPTTTWKEYEFKGKPGDPARAPPQVAPYHLRLDWLMWFAAMSSYHHHPWIVHLSAKLLEGDPQVLGLLKTNPFPTNPPRYIRALHYRYRFATPEERRARGQWWMRTYLKEYLPPLSLEDRSLQDALRRQGWPL